jgi:uncharacterized membrane protein HdeD (DUF308 family)
MITVIFIASYIMRGTCFAGAAWLAYHGKDGWGWLIFAGIVTGLSVDNKK